MAIDAGRRAARRLAGAALLLAASAGGVRAQAPELEQGPPPRVFVPSFGVTERITDNVRLQPRGGRGDEITTLSPGASVRYQGPRANLNLSGALNVDRYAEDSSLDKLRTGLFGNGQARLIDEYAAVDFQTFATQQQTNRQFSAAQPEAPNGAPGQQTVYGYSFSPFVSHRFGSWANAEARYRHGDTYFGTPSNATVAPAQGLSSSSLDEFSSFVETGPAFTQLASRLSARSSTTGLPQGDLQQGNVDLTTQYVIIRSVSALATLGYDDIQVPGLVKDLSGVYFLGGFQVAPGPRTRIRFQFGERYGGFTMQGEATYLIGAVSTARLTYSDTISAQPAQFLTNLDNAQTDAFGNVIDRQTGLVFTPREQAQLNLNNQPFRQKRLLITVPFIDGRNTYTTTYAHTEREALTAVAGIRQSDQSADTLTLSLAREVAHQTTATVTAAYTTSAVAGLRNSDIDTVRLQGGLVYRYSEATTFQALYSYLDQSAASGPVHENAVLLGVRRAF